MDALAAAPRPHTDARVQHSMRLELFCGYDIVRGVSHRHGSSWRIEALNAVHDRYVPKLPVAKRHRHTV